MRSVVEPNTPNRYFPLPFLLLSCHAAILLARLVDFGTVKEGGRNQIRCKSESCRMQYTIVFGFLL
jgi:hypothetical protein